MMSRCATHSYEKHAQIFSDVVRLIKEVIVEKIVYRLTVFCKLGVKDLVILKYVPLIKKCQKVIKIKPFHLLGNIWTLQCYFLNEPPYFKIRMAGNAIVKNE
jgi:hypothetical protein